MQKQEKKKNKKKNGKKKPNKKTKTNLDLIFHILHSLTSGSTWDNTSARQK